MSDLVDQNRRLAYEWKNGVTPSGIAFAKLHYAGADVMYILTGQRSAKR